jgi:hypothetical protein
VRSGTSSSSSLLGPTATPQPSEGWRSDLPDEVPFSQASMAASTWRPFICRGGLAYSAWMRLPANMQTNKPAGRLSIRLASYFADLFVS